MENFKVTDEIKNGIKEDFNLLTGYMGMSGEVLPEINFVCTDINNTAEFKLGNCFYDKMKLSMNEYICSSKGVISIFVDSIYNACKYLLKESGIAKAGKFYMHLIRYVAIHELIHHLQMKKGMIVKGDKSESDYFIESSCIETSKDFINKVYSGDKIMSEIVKLDLCQLAENYEKADEEIIKKTKMSILNSISDLLDAEIDFSNPTKKKSK